MKKLFRIFFFLTFLYFLFVIFDYFIQRFSYNLTAERDPQAILLENKLNEKKIPERKVAYNNGFRNPIVPLYYEFYPWLEIAKKYNLFPLGAQPKTNIAYCDEGDGLKKYFTDRFGYRNNDELWKNEKNIKAIIIGDSFVQGACVDDDQTISSNLMMLSKNNNKVLNLGQGGHGPMHYASTIKIFLSELKTENLIIVFYANDNLNEKNSITEKIFFSKYNVDYLQRNNINKELEPSLKLKNVYAESSTLALNDEKDFFEKGNFIKRSLKYFTFYGIRKTFSNIYKDLSEEDFPYSTKIAIDTALKFCNNKCHTSFVYIPSSKFWAYDPRSEKYQIQIQNYLKNFNKKLININEIIHDGKSYYSIGIHLNAKGYSFLAEEIFKELKNFE
jgi:hypothetical protein